MMHRAGLQVEIASTVEDMLRLGPVRANSTWVRLYSGLDFFINHVDHLL